MTNGPSRPRTPSSGPWFTSATTPSGKLSDHLAAAVGIIRNHTSARPSVGLILGSGLGSYADKLEDPVVIDYREIPGFCRTTVEGHAGQMVIGKRGGLVCAALQGRFHFYEGHSAAQVAFPARVLVALGAHTLIVTNAAGGLSFPPATLMLIRDHLNLFPESPLIGHNDDTVGPRFPDMTQAYPAALRDMAREVAGELGIDLAEGVYAGSSGPAYETPAEVKMLGILGADATGMSTVPEVIAANHMGAKVLGISCITNHAAGLGQGEPLSHDEVTETAAQVRERFQSLLDGILGRLGKDAQAV